MKIAFLIAVVLLACTAAHAEIYSWEDEGGTHFTDDAQKIPKKKRKKATVRSGGTEARSWRYFNTQYNTNYYYDPSTVTYQRRDRYSVLIKEEFQHEFYEKSVEIDCNRMMYRIAGSSQANNSYDGDGSCGDCDFDDFVGLDNSMRALSRAVCH